MPIDAINADLHSITAHTINNDDNGTNMSKKVVIQIQVADNARTTNNIKNVLAGINDIKD